MIFPLAEQFMQLSRIFTWKKSGDFNGIWTHDLGEPLKVKRGKEFVKSSQRTRVRIPLKAPEFFQMNIRDDCINCPASARIVSSVHHKTAFHNSISIIQCHFSPTASGIGWMQVVVARHLWQQELAVRSSGNAESCWTKKDSRWRWKEWFIGVV